MIKNLATYGTRFCAVEHAEQNRYFFLQLKKKQKELIIHNQGKVTDISVLAETLQGQKHLHLVINNEQVLTKAVTQSNLPEERLVQTAFPNITLSDFYYQIYSNERHSFISVSRKEYIDEIIATYATHKISVIDFSLGSLAIKPVLSFVQESEISTTNAVLSLEKGWITSIDKKEVAETPYTINELELSNTYILSLGGIIGYYSGQAQSSIQKQLHQEYGQRRFFNLGFKFALGFLFISLLINFLFFSSYQSKKAQYNSVLLINETKKKELINLKDLISRKRKLAESISSSANSRIAWYFNEISVSVPPSVLLKNMSYQPVESTIKENKKILFKDRTIEVSGQSRYHEDINKWIATLEEQDWIDEVSIVKYGSGSKTALSFDFSIRLYE